MKGPLHPRREATAKVVMVQIPYRSDTTKYFKKRLKKGRVAVCGNYEVLFGNAYELLVALTDESYEPTESFSLEDGQVCTMGFDHGDTVLCARSPHITMGNL